ncbi:MAG: hypothetical protein KDJ26_07420 [Alphaproteobacteria bacterium]|nr:hypothetical protein [Alphaproteobacteria bacterium]MCB1551811.1 hypothetical protein [Alphaproteobacteria bacterium]MCB9985243.1 hypothetical protein [Micavibrio sp.]HRK98676.1 hypothetical protein [Alphaproteobacteria bacterium]
MKFFYIATFCISLLGAWPTHTANARGYSNPFNSHKTDGPEYKNKFFEVLSIADFKLHMPEEEAISIIAKDGWTGGWSRSGSIPPETIETTGFPFKQGKDDSITLYRYRTFDTNILKIYAIEYTRKFDQNQNVQTLTTKLIEKYGEPTNTELSNLKVVLQYSPDNKMKYNQNCISEYQRNQIQCLSYVNWLKGPKFTITVLPRSIEMVLEDEGEALNHQTNIRTRQNIDLNTLEKDTSEGIDLDF